MANLIITVIAIALVAVASLMGAYYGGSAFLNNQSAAAASTDLNQAQQLAGAFQAYLNDNNNVVPAGGLSGPANSLVAGNYLQSVPQYPAVGGGVSQNMIVGQVGGAGHYYAWADMGIPGATGPGTSTDPTAAACLRIMKVALGTAPAQLATLAPGTIANAGNNTFGCAISSAATVKGPIANGALTGSGTVAIPSGHYLTEYLIY